jgi:cation diffusion facilitator CzcD-associated flavoprotein CzcO
MIASMPRRLLIIGAGPFGLALGAWARQSGCDYVMVGTAMEFWRRHMPAGMILRSDADWHLDPGNVCTIDRFFAVTGLTRESQTPFPLRTYLAYTDWFQRELAIRPIEARVVSLDLPAGPEAPFRATLDTGQVIEASHVAVAVGFWYFRELPEALLASLPPGRWSHASEAVDMTAFASRRVTIVGGRQSAFEWAALLCEAGAVHVDVVHRHDSPRFDESEWEWIPALVARTEHDPSWFRRLSEAEQQAMARRLWAEGRLKIEPWLEPRLRSAPVTLWPNAEVARSVVADNAIEIQLTSGARLRADHVILATGYKVDIHRVPFLSSAAIRDRLRVRNGFPVLDEHFQTNIPRLYITSMAATQDFGPFFGFTVSARVSAMTIGRAIQLK